MSLAKLKTGMLMTLKMLLRRKIVLLLVFVIPILFLLVVKFTSSQNPVLIQLASVEEKGFLKMAEQNISFIFFAVASAGFLVSFLALNLIQKNRDAHKRLIICGYHSVEVLGFLLLTLIIFIAIISLFIAVLTHLFHPLEHFWLFCIALSLIGFIYGGYGLLVGILVKGELEGILLIVLLVNIDVGWLQNPVFYSSAENQFIIKSLPAYYPSQASVIAAFTDHSIITPTLNSLIYAAVFFFLATGIFFIKMSKK